MQKDVCEIGKILCFFQIFSILVRRSERGDRRLVGRLSKNSTRSSIYAIAARLVPSTLWSVPRRDRPSSDRNLCRRRIVSQRVRVDCSTGSTRLTRPEVGAFTPAASLALRKRFKVLDSPTDLRLLALRRPSWVLTREFSYLVLRPYRAASWPGLDPAPA